MTSHIQDDVFQEEEKQLKKPMVTYEELHGVAVESEDGPMEVTSKHAC